MPNPNPPHTQTDGLLVPAFVQVTGASGISTITPNKNVGPGQPNPMGYKVTMSVSASGGFASLLTATPVIVDVANTTLPTFPFMSQVTASSNGVALYTGTVTGGGSNAYAGMEFTVTGFTNAANNGTFLCTASTTTTLTLANRNAVPETHASVASAAAGTPVFYSYNGVSGGPSWYKPNPAPGYSGDVASVTSGGVIIALAVGTALIEVAFPTYDNSLGNSSSGQKEPVNMIYTQITATVIP